MTRNSRIRSFAESGFTSVERVDLLPLGADADYYLLLSMPTAPGTCMFDLGITDANGVFSSRTIMPTINPFNSGTPSPNRTIPDSWREQFS